MLRRGKGHPGERMKTLDWTRLLPRKEGTTKKERVVYLVEFLRHRRGSRVAVSKAVKELMKLTK